MPFSRQSTRCRSGGTSVRHSRPPAHHRHRLRRDDRLSIHLLQVSSIRKRCWLVFRRDRRISLTGAGHPVRRAGGVHRGKLPRLAAVQRLGLGLSAGVDHGGRAGAHPRGDPDASVRVVAPDRHLHLPLRHDQLVLRVCLGWKAREHSIIKGQTEFWASIDTMSAPTWSRLPPCPARREGTCSSAARGGRPLRRSVSTSSIRRANSD